MPTLKIEYGDDDTTLERLESLASQSGLTCEELAQRAIAEFLKDYGLKEPLSDFQPANLRALFAGHGITKK